MNAQFSIMLTAGERAAITAINAAQDGELMRGRQGFGDGAVTMRMARKLERLGLAEMDNEEWPSLIRLTAYARQSGVVAA